MLSTSQSLLAVLALAHLAHVSSAVSCYGLLGNAYSAASGVVPCNSSATGSGTSHSTCCHSTNNDACLSTGLCYNTAARIPANLIWATGCTDPTLSDPSCPKYCHGKTFGTLGNYNLRFCGGSPPGTNDSQNLWCCGTGLQNQDIADCCKNSFALGDTTGTVVAQLNSNVNLAANPSSSSPASSSSTTSTAGGPTGSNSAPSETCPAAPSNSGLVAGIAVVAVLFGLSLIALGVLGWYLTKLRRQLAVGKADAVVPVASRDSYQQEPDRSTMASPPTAVATPSTPYTAVSQVPPYQIPPSTEMPDTGLQEAENYDQRVGRSELPEKGRRYELPEKSDYTGWQQ